MSLLGVFMSAAPTDGKYYEGIQQCRAEILERGIEMRLPISTLSKLCGVSEEDAAQTADFLGVDPATLGYSSPLFTGSAAS